MNPTAEATAARANETALWGVGFLDDGTELPISYRDIDQDAIAAEAALAALEVPVDANLLLLSTLPNIGTVWPFAVASARGSRAVYFADATAFDASRTEMFTRRLNIDAILGVSEAVVAGLGEAGSAPKVLQRARVVAADPALVAGLRAQGVNAVRWLRLGPAIAIDCSYGILHYDESEWTLHSEGRQLLIRANSKRAVGDRTFVIGISARAGQSDCPCGRTADLTLDGSG